MKRLMAAGCFVLCFGATTYAQGRGGRQGGPGGGGPTGPLCLNPSDVQHMETKTTTMPVDGVPVTSRTITITGTSTGGQQLLAPCPAGLGGGDVLGKSFFSSDLILSHQQAIGLSDAQRSNIGTLMVDATTRFVPVQLKVTQEVEKLRNLIDDVPVNEAAVLDAMDRVLANEREIKREQLRLMVRLKNLLTPQQQEALSKLRPAN